jgi:NDP-sugar pyrophosphorylase family protein
VEPEVMEMVPDGKPYSFERNVFPALLAAGETVCGFDCEGYWMDTGTPEKYLQLHGDLLEGKSTQYAPPAGPRFGENTKVSPKALFFGPVIVGDNCTIGSGTALIGPVVIGDGCTIGEHCTIENAVLWRNVSLGWNVELADAIVADGCRFGDEAFGEKIVLAENVTVGREVALQPGTKVAPGQTVAAGG